MTQHDSEFDQLPELNLDRIEEQYNQQVDLMDRLLRNNLPSQSWKPGEAWSWVCELIIGEEPDLTEEDVLDRIQTYEYITESTDIDPEDRFTFCLLQFLHLYAEDFLANEFSKNITTR